MCRFDSETLLLDSRVRTGPRILVVCGAWQFGHAPNPPMQPTRKSAARLMGHRWAAAPRRNEMNVLDFMTPGKKFSLDYVIGYCHTNGSRPCDAREHAKHVLALYKSGAAPTLRECAVLFRAAQQARAVDWLRSASPTTDAQPLGACLMEMP